MDSKTINSYLAGYNSTKLYFIIHARLHKSFMEGWRTLNEGFYYIVLQTQSPLFIFALKYLAQ